MSINGLIIRSLSVSVSSSEIELHSDGTPSHAPRWITEFSTDFMSANQKQSHVFLHNSKILGRPQQRIGVLIKRGLRSAEWRIVMEQLDSVNVFIFPVLKFKKIEPILATWVYLELSEKEWLPAHSVPQRPWGIWSSINPKIPKRFYSSKLNRSFADEKFYWKKKTDTYNQGISCSVAPLSDHLS